MRRTGFEGIAWGLVAPGLLALIGLAQAADAAARRPAGDFRTGIEADKRYSTEGLKQIYIEVKELGPYPGESFIKQEFFLGPADDDTYKKEHIVVMIQGVDSGERMRIQVTEMKTRPDNPRIQLAGQVRAIICSIANGELSVLRADYEAGEVEALARDILRAVRQKKKLLEMLGPATCARPFFGHNRELARGAGSILRGSASYLFKGVIT